MGDALFRFEHFCSVSNKILRFIGKVDSLFAFSVHHTQHTAHSHALLLLLLPELLLLRPCTTLFQIRNLDSIARRTDAYFYLLHHIKHEFPKSTIHDIYARGTSNSLSIYIYVGISCTLHGRFPIAFPMQCRGGWLCLNAFCILFRMQSRNEW